MKKLYLISMCMIMLIMSFPVVHAQTLSIIKIQGQDGIENYYRANDVISIEVLAGMPGETAVERDQLRVYIDDGDTYQIFDSCTLAEGTTDTYNCVMDKTVFGQSGSHDFKIRLYDDLSKHQADAIPLVERVAPLTVDSIPPTINSIDIVETITNDPTITIDYDVDDTAIQGNPSLCSGIASLELRSNEPGGPLVTTITGDGSCSMSGSQSVTINEPDGIKTICLVAYDFLNQVDQAAHCDTFTLDRAAPTISLLRMLDDDLQEIEYISSTGDDDINVEITFDDLSLDKSSVTADFNQITTVGGYMNKAPTLWTNNTAMWQNVPSRGYTSCVVGVFAEDALGNIVAQNVPCTIKFDDEGPESKSISTGLISQDGKPLLGRDTLIQITFRETGVGMSEEKAYLDLTRITGQAKRKADECTQSGSDWICSWNVTATQATGEVQVGVHADTQDDLGNKVKLLGRIFDVSFDVTAPVINTKTYRVIGGPYSVLNLTVRGDQVEFTINAENFDCATSFADFSAFGDDSQVPPTQCNELTGDIVFFADVVISGYYVAQPTFHIRDTTMNSATDTMSVEVYETKDDIENPNYWVQRPAECSPVPIDRGMAELINYNVVCKIPLTSSHPKAYVSLFHFDSGACTSENLDYFMNVNAFNTGPSTIAGQKDIYLSIWLDKRRMEVNELNLTCPSYIGTRLDRTVVLNQEQENLSVTLNFFENPLGMLPSIVAEKVLSVSEGNAKLSEKIEKFEEFMAYGTKICTLKSTIMSVVGAIEAVIVLLATTSGPFTEVPQTALCGTSTTIKTMKETGLSQFVEPICNFLNCNVAAKDMKGQMKVTTDILWEGAPWCRDWKKATEAFGLDPDSKLGNFVNQSIGPWPKNVKDSLGWSLMCLCLPGILAGMNKYYGIECKYGLCLLEDVGERGLDVQFCEAEKAYDQCAFLWGEIFNFFPFANISVFIEKLIKLFADVETFFITQGIHLLCGKMCAQPSKWPYLACALPNTIEAVLDAYSSVEKIADSDFWGSPSTANYCSDFLDKKAELKIS